MILWALSALYEGSAGSSLCNMLHFRSFHRGFGLLNPALSEEALALKSSLLSSGNAHIFPPIATSPSFAPTINDITDFLTKSFSKVVSVGKAPHVLVAFDRVDTRIATALECNSLDPHSLLFHNTSRRRSCSASQIRNSCHPG